MPDLVGHDETVRSKKAEKKFYVEQLSAEIDEKDRDVGGGDAGDAGGLGDGGGAVAYQFLATFDRETLHFIKVEVGGNLDIFQPIVLLGLLFFALDVARVLNSYLDGFYNFGRKCSMWNNFQEVGQRELGASHQLSEFARIG